MTKYIDAEKLKELLDAKYKEFTEKAKKDCPLQYQYMADGLDIAEQFVDSLQQEQPDVDLEKEIEDHSVQMPMSEFTHDREVEKFIEWAKKEFRHFYELGKLNARKEENK